MEPSALLRPVLTGLTVAAGQDVRPGRAIHVESGSRRCLCRLTVTMTTSHGRHPGDGGDPPGSTL